MLQTSDLEVYLFEISCLQFPTLKEAHVANPAAFTMAGTGCEHLRQNKTEVGNGTMTFNYHFKKYWTSNWQILSSSLSYQCLIPNKQSSSHQLYMPRRYSAWGSAQLYTPNMVYCKKLPVSLASFLLRRCACCSYTFRVEGLFNCPSTAAFWPWGKPSLDW